MGRTEAVVALVVGAVDYGEADRVVRLLAADRGRFAAMARHVRSARPRLPGLDTGSVVRAQLSHGRGGLPVLSAADPVRLPRRAREDLDRLAYLAYGCEVASELAPEHHEAEKLFVLAETWLDLLEGAPLPGIASRLAFESKALTFAGLAPALVICPRCGEPLSGEVAFDPESGGGVHLWCGAGRPVRASTLAALEELRRTPLASTPGLPYPSEGRWLLADFVSWHVGHAIKSRGLVETLDEATPPADPG